MKLVTEKEVKFNKNNPFFIIEEKIIKKLNVNCINEIIWHLPYFFQPYIWLHSNWLQWHRWEQISPNNGWGHERAQCSPKYPTGQAKSKKTIRIKLNYHIMKYYCLIIYSIKRYNEVLILMLLTFAYSSNIVIKIIRINSFNTL